jgi:hypothetical protein
MGVYLTGVYLMVVCLISVRLTGGCPIDMHLTGMYLIAVYIMGVKVEVERSIIGFRMALVSPTWIIDDVIKPDEVSIVE